MGGGGHNDQGLKTMMDPNEILLLAANTGLVGDMMFALKRGADVDTVDDDGYAAIHLAALSDNPLTVQALTQRKVKLEVLNEDGLTAFQLAMDEGRYLSAEALATAGCDTAMIWPDNSTAAHKAVLADQVVLLSVLMQDGPPIDQRNNDGFSAIMLAGQSGRAACVRMLLAGGAKISDLNNLTTTPEIQRLMMAWKAGMALAEHQ